MASDVIFPTFEDKLAAAIKRNVTDALQEDLNGAEDVSGALLDSNVMAKARIITRQPGIFCGRPWVEETAVQVDSNIEVTWHVADGDPLAPNQTLYELVGVAKSLLCAERTMLNFVQLLSGTATKTRFHADLIKHTSTKLLDTRKTVPGLRDAQKYAVACAGGNNHRMGLYDAYLLKENHIAACGGVRQAITAARNKHPDMKIEIEVETLEQLQEAIDAKADIAMVDNFTVTDTYTAVDMAKGKILLEASGNVDENSITDIAATGVDYISMGALTKQVDPLDLSMRIIETWSTSS